MGTTSRSHVAIKWTPEWTCQSGWLVLTMAGSTCSGKTTAAGHCTDVEGLAIHEFDEIGVPSTADTLWRQRSMEQWIQRIVEYQDRGVDVLLTGQSPLGEVLASPSAPRINGIAACLLDVDDRERLRPNTRQRRTSRSCYSTAGRSVPPLTPSRWNRSMKSSSPRWSTISTTHS